MKQQDNKKQSSTHIVSSINQFGTDDETKYNFTADDDTMGLRDDEDISSFKMMKMIKTTYNTFRKRYYKPKYDLFPAERIINNVETYFFRFKDDNEI